MRWREFDFAVVGSFRILAVMRRLTPVATVLVAVLLPALVHAGEFWLQPERAKATPGAVVSFTACAGEGFLPGAAAVPVAEAGPLSGWLEDAALEIRVPSLSPGTGWRIESVLPRPGIAVLCLSGRPVRRTIPSEDVTAHVRRLRLDPESLLSSTERPAVWTEDRTTHAKAFVRVGEPAGGDAGWSREFGLPLELVPAQDPTALRAGGSFPVRLLRAGLPAARMAVVFLSEGETREHVVVTDAAGLVSVVLDVSGAWLVTASDVRASGSQGPWDCQVATLRLEVGP